MLRVAREPVRAPITAGEVELEALGPVVGAVDWKRVCWRGRALMERGRERRTERAARLAFDAIRLWSIVYV
jgi:hypothetical protein